MLVLALYMYTFRSKKNEEPFEQPPTSVRIVTCEEYAAFKLQEGGIRVVEAIEDRNVARAFLSYRLTMQIVQSTNVLPVREFEITSAAIHDISEEQKQSIAKYFENDECPIVLIPPNVAAALVRRFGPQPSSTTIGAFYGLKRLVLWTLIDDDMDYANSAHTTFAWVTKRWTPHPVHVQEQDKDEDEDEDEDEDTTTEPDQMQNQVQHEDDGSFKTVEGTSFRAPVKSD